MPNPVSGQYVTPGDFRQQVDGIKAAIAQLQRNMTREKPTPKIPTAGGIVGQASIHSQAGTVQALAGPDGFQVASPRYNTPIDPEDNSTPAWVSFDPTFPWRIVVEPGWYSAVMLMWLAWGSQADCPEALSPSMLGGWDDPHQDYSTFARAHTSTGWGIYQYLNHGLTRMHDGGYFQAALQYHGSDAASDATTARINWTITKHG